MNSPTCRVSVIICTRNRAASLERTLRALDRITIPPGWNAELLLVDNASTDGTARVIQGSSPTGFAVRHLAEDRPGLSYARNTGIAAARGEAILFTDDDVVPAKDWLERLASPLLAGRFDAVVGPIAIAAALQRPWMKPIHRQWLAGLDADPGEELELVGANMGLGRSVLRRVPGFDVELGAGAMGFGEESLFSLQLKTAGFRIGFADQATVVHEFDSSRLLHAEWIGAARKRGQLQAYLLHHWFHDSLRQPRLRELWLTAKLNLRRILRPPGPPAGEGCPVWEMSYVRQIARCRQFVIERRRPANYPASQANPCTPPPAEQRNIGRGRAA